MFGGSGNDTLDGGDGQDSIYGQSLNDTFLASQGSDFIFGGIGNDTCFATGGRTLTDETLVVNINDLGNGTAAKQNDGSVDTLIGIENIVASETGATDVITLTDTGAGFTTADVSGLDDNAVGTFTPSNGKPVIVFGPGEARQISDILSRDASGTFQIISGDESGNVGGISFSNFETINFDVICFARDTAIQTDLGEVPVQDLRAGDLEQTLDHGAQPIRWIDNRKLGADELAAHPRLRPIRISKDALAPGVPSRDLVVSPQHRVLVSSEIAMKIFGTREVLVPAKLLLSIDGFDVVEDASEVTCYHILLDEHQVIIANGAAAESLFTGPQALKTLSRDAIEEIRYLFPDILTENHVPKPARMIPEKGRMMRSLAHRHQKNGKQLCDQGQLAVG